MANCNKLASLAFKGLMAIILLMSVCGKLSQHSCLLGALYLPTYLRVQRGTWACTEADPRG